jgi:acetyltransferase EpsM
MKPKIVIIGAGGHGKVVCDAIIAQNKYEIIGFVDTSIEIGTIVTRDLKIIELQNTISNLKGIAEYFIVAVGNNTIREKITLETIPYFKSATIIHPSAIIGFNVTIGEGTVVLANSVINASSFIGKNTIINTGNIIDHDCKIGNNVRLSIGTLVGSNSEIGDGYSASIGEKINSFSKINL